MRVSTLHAFIGFAVVLWFAVVLPLAAQQDKPQLIDPKLGDAIGNFGVAFGGLIRSAAEQNAVAKPSNSEVEQTLNRMEKSFMDGVSAGRATVGLLGSTFEVVYTGVDVYTGGASWIATGAARWATKQGLDAFYDNIHQNTLNYLAK